MCVVPTLRQDGGLLQPAADDSACRKIDQLEAFFSRRLGETVVERDNLQRRRTSFGCNESRRKLEGVRRSKRMNAKKPERVLANDLARFDLVPTDGKLFQPMRRPRRRLSNQAKPLARGERSPKRIPPAIPTTPRRPSLRAPAPAAIVSYSPPRAAAQSPKRPRTSPPLPALVNERANRRRSGAGRRRGENSRRRDSPARPQDAVSNEPRQSSAWTAFLTTRDWLQPRDRTASINNQNRLAALEAIDQGAQAILGLGNTSSFHRA